MNKSGRVCTVVVSFLILCRVAAISEDASMFRGNPAHSGVYDSPGVARFGGVKWRFHTRGMVISSPAVTAGKVYFGSSDGNLYALVADSGEQQWKFDTKSRVPSSPA